MRYLGRRDRPFPIIPPVPIKYEQSALRGCEAEQTPPCPQTAVSDPSKSPIPTGIMSWRQTYELTLAS